MRCGPGLALEEDETAALAARISTRDSQTGVPLRSAPTP